LPYGYHVAADDHPDRCADQHARELKTRLVISAATIIEVPYSGVNTARLNWLLSATPRN
jgi:hypothetical protein